MYSVEQVAALLGLHVRTVRGYIRAGRLPAVRIGKQYRIARADLDALTGRPGPAAPAGPAGLEVSSIAQLDGVDRATADRLATLVLAGANTHHDPARPLRVQTVHDEERHRMKIVILGDAAATAELLRLLDAVLHGPDGLLAGRGTGNA
ncbi:helix-turn-helix domain-containing protein [Micromonospora sp. PPF5-17]|uniref:DNA-binding protein n=2 Tax=Micromonosporaceae TaxID=28056 RepID=A0ABX9WKB5_9ACTN|nr:helix-turn-helix domain-containing protein [Micromonospora sp. PPF5-17B]NES35472.1 helix-turn-helix domain-containing protein [Micromonospora solifontis]NES55371.1 helix-turn-helix domain-containing protein [Micromonospora sp. PPF5-6]RNM00722.1 DNA-binding protein [Micromonospora solifontis]